MSKLLLFINPGFIHSGQYKSRNSNQVNGPRQANSLLPFLCELVANELLLGQLGLLVHLFQHLVHHAEQGTAQAQQLIQEHIVMGVAPDVGPRSCERLTHTSQQPLRQHTHSPASTPWPAQASPKQGNQGTWGLYLDAACRRVAPTVQRRGCGVALVILQESRHTEWKLWPTTKPSITHQRNNKW